MLKFKTVVHNPLQLSATKRGTEATAGNISVTAELSSQTATFINDNQQQKVITDAAILHTNMKKQSHFALAQSV